MITYVPDVSLSMYANINAYMSPDRNIARSVQPHNNQVPTVVLIIFRIPHVN